MGLENCRGAQELFLGGFSVQGDTSQGQDGGTITLLVSKVKAEVGDPLTESQAVSFLQETWIRVHGSPDKLRV